jgi:hypothetical protein
LPGYLNTKIEAEQYIKEKCPNLIFYSVRPGFIWNKLERGWSVPLKSIVNLGFFVNQMVV